jgi:hypothetical protein
VETISALFFSRVTWLTASTTEEVGTSTITVDLVHVEPLARDAGADFRLVLVVGDYDLDLDALSWRRRSPPPPCARRPPTRAGEVGVGPRTGRS